MASWRGTVTYIDQPALRFAAHLVVLWGHQVNLPPHWLASILIKVSQMLAGRELRHEFLDIFKAVLDPATLRNSTVMAALTHLHGTCWFWPIICRLKLKKILQVKA